ncbi:MAG: carbohydrate ABC transporter permease, partial [Oscillospiraceae bacterium]
MAVKNRIRQGSRFATFLIYFIVGVCCFITLYPMYYVFIMSISEPKEVLAMNVFLYPKGFYLGSYTMLIKNVEMWRSYLNTIIYTVASTGLLVITSVI